MSRFLKFSQIFNINSYKLTKPCNNHVMIRYSSFNNVPKSDILITVYKFKYILPLAIVNRLKYYQTVTTGVFLPSAMVLNQLNVIDNPTLQLFAALSLTGCLSFHIVGYVFYKYVGFIYYNENNNIFQIAYIDFWGKRKDIQIKSDDIYLNNDPKKKPSFFGAPLVKLSTNEVFTVNLRFGDVIDERINNIFVNK